MPFKKKTAAAPEAPKQSGFTLYHPPQQLPDGLWIHRWGNAPVAYKSHLRLTPAWQELMIYHAGWDGERGYRGPTWHFSQALRLFHPDLIWHDWMKQRVDDFCNPNFAFRDGQMTFRHISWVGSAGAGKTNDVAMFAVPWWLCDPLNSCVILTSTSRDKIGQRAWPVVVSMWQQMKAHHMAPGHLLNSTMALQAVKGDHKHSIFGQAVREGETQKAVDRIKGQHMLRIMLVCDEATSQPEAILETIPNVRKGCREFILVSICNAVSHLDPGGRLSEPKAGWNSISIDTGFWRTKGVQKWQVEPGICRHFDGKKSPNVRAGKTLYPFLYTYEDWQTALRNSEGQKTLQFWSNDRGFWPPDGCLNTVISEQMVEKYGGMGQWGTPEGYTFLSQRIPIAALDPAFGGDECKIIFGFIGDVNTGKKVIQVTDHFAIPILIDSKDEIEVQIAKRVVKECIARGVKPEFLGIEGSGTGRGAASRIREEYGECIKLESGGRPSDLPASEDDPRPGHEVFDRRITQLGFQVKAFLGAGQLRGLYPEAVSQGASREYTMVARKLSVATKEKFKEKLGRSPDDFDALAVLCEVAFQHGVTPGHVSGEARRELEQALNPIEDPPFNNAMEMFDDRDEAEPVIAGAFDFYA